MLFRTAVQPFVLLLIVASLAAADAQQDNIAQSIGEQVYCVCGGCVGLLNHCPHPESECSTQAEMHKLIRKELAAGKSETTVLQDLVLRYGVQVLASPPVKGFNLTVWFLPGLGLITSLGLLIVIVRRWRKPAAAAVPQDPVDPKVLAAVEEEMKKAGG